MRRNLYASIILALLAAAFGAGCAADPPPTAAPDEPTAVPTQPGGAVEPTREPIPTLPPGPRTETPSPTAPPTPEATEVHLPAGVEPLVARAREDLAHRLHLPSDAIRLVSVQAVQWPDASLGCPRPGMAYAQVITPGFIILLEAQDQTYAYHADVERRVVLCGDEGRRYPVIPVDPGEIMDGKPWMPVD